MAYNIALVGNPNCGKTTLFNELTGSNQYVGNWAGVTVEKKIGKVKSSKLRINIVDLPGIYSLYPYTMEEIIARDYIIDEKPDLILNIIDGTNIERNLYLTVQLLELNIPVVVAINMMDDVKAKGDKIDCDSLARDLGIKIVPIVARKRQNLDSLLLVAEEIIEKNISQNHKIRYDYHTTKALKKLEQIVLKYTNDNQYLFYATKLLEGDTQLEEKLKISYDDITKINQIAISYEDGSKYGDRETMLADSRYKFITSIVSKNVIKNKHGSVLTISDKIDMIVTNRFLAIPVFLLIISLVFKLTFGKFGSTLKSFVEYGIDNFIALPLEKVLLENEMPLWTHQLLVKAIIGGVGAVLEFLPQIMILFLFLSILEDSGYMARTAFIMDRFLRRLGLNGKSFIPMIMGFGCTTPAVMAARTMENEKDKKLTILLIPFMSCGARLTIYMLLTGMFFPNNQGIIIFSLYFIGLIVAVIAGVVLKKTLFKSNKSNFIMELPPYRFPTLKTMLLHMWEKCKGFLIKAGTIIFSMSVLIWVMQKFNFKLQYVANSEESIIGYIGRFIAPIFTPLGFGQWQASVSLITGLVAKESVVSTMNVLYEGNISQIFSKLSSYSFMIFTLLYMPCVSAFVSMKRELGSWRWAMGAAIMEVGIAYIVALLIYQIGNILLR